jgi:DNA polymerase III delta subunit
VIPAVEVPAALARSLEPVRAVYGFGGADPLLAASLSDRVFHLVVDREFASFDSETIDLSARPVHELVNSAHLAPFASSRRLVVGEHAEALKRRERHSETTQLSALIEKPPPATCIVLISEEDPDSKSRSKSIFSDGLDAAIRQSGLLVSLPAPSADHLAAWARKIAESRGVTLKGQAASMLAESARRSRLTLVSELEKVLNYCGEATEAGPEVVAAVRSRDPEDMIFAVVEATGRRNASAALRALDECLLFAESPHAVAGRLLALLLRQFRLIAQGADLISLGYLPRDVRNLPADLAQALPGEASIVSMAWKASDIFRQAGLWSADGLAYAFSALCEADLANKGGEEGSEDVRTNLKALLVRLCGSADPGAAS